jgi:hypothetical protein
VQEGDGRRGEGGSGRAGSFLYTTRKKRSPRAAPLLLRKPTSHLKKLPPIEIALRVMFQSEVGCLHASSEDQLLFS